MTGWNKFKRAGSLSLFLTVAAGPSFAADADNGKQLALRWCSACHLVANDQELVSGASVPSFYDISKAPDFNEKVLTTFLADPHPRMPNMVLSNSEIADLTHYIGSLSE